MDRHPLMLMIYFILTRRTHVLDTFFSHISLDFLGLDVIREGGTGKVSMREMAVYSICCLHCLTT
jgi:hypothetical protein